MSKKSTGLQSWGEINIPSASKLGQHNRKADINLENSCISTKAKCQHVWKVTGRRNGLLHFFFIMDTQDIWTERCSEQVWQVMSLL